MSDDNSLELSIVMPCLNEAETVAGCISKALTFLRRSSVNGEVIIADNGSTDGSQDLAEKAGAIVIYVEHKGYGSAIMGGIRAARGKYIVMGDADGSYDFLNLDPFLEKLREGYDLVMGNRFRGGILPKAMPRLHRYLGNPVLSGIGRILFRGTCGDFHCGLRGFAKAVAQKMDLHTTGMEFASEMVVKAALYDMRIAEVPTTLSPDGRSRRSHLRPWSDGWRHLRFLLLYSPNWLFLYPGLILMLLGLIIGGSVISGPLRIYGITFDLHSLLYAAMGLILGFQCIVFALVGRTFAVIEGLMPSSKGFESISRYVKLEIGLIVGVILSIIGCVGSFYTFFIWRNVSFGALDFEVTMRIAIPSLTVLMLGVQMIFSSFLFGILRLRRR
ncbi:MAG: dolichol-P-glucose synthetase [Deltaproteobacteria bacterium HGW-Deltaproteobacteria-15]|jgi:glycosyltransferase involved in cell wall biosynthesis|nr:MAG: dolichol-P-glucose synthetase [Deltaproteobacteria bacterium HGW-Deltaproteobacteria-15]